LNMSSTMTSWSMCSRTNCRMCRAITWSGFAAYRDDLYCGIRGWASFLISDVRSGSATMWPATPHPNTLQRAL
jgi:hypothetical protein